MIDRAMRFCTSCQAMRNEDGGYKKPNSNRGWCCALCLARKTLSPYMSVKNMVKLCPQKQ